MSDPLKPGDPAPLFELPIAGGKRIDLRGLKGQPVVVYFYPKDDTTACTQEALNFTEKMAEFARAKTAVIGVSRDPVAKHDKFAAKYGLKVILASDEEGEVCARYGVWVEKSMYGKTYMGIERSTFLIDSKGRIRRVWRKVRVAGHVEDVLAEVKAL